jgi:uridylate kinase
MGDQQFGVDPAVVDADRPGSSGELQAWASDRASSSAAANIFRGLAASAKGMDRADRRLHGEAGHRHQRLALQDGLEQQNVTTRVVTASRCAPWPSRSSAGAPSGTREGPRRHLRAGTGNPYFTTDTPRRSGAWRSRPT